MLAPSPVKSFIDALRVVHDENAHAEHLARICGGLERSTMFLTPFVYQFFIYNSLYQVNWTESVRGETLLSIAGKEEPKQKAFETFLKGKTTCHDLVAAFQELPCLNGNEEWTEVVPDPFITVEHGSNFFATVRAFTLRLGRMDKSGNTVTLLDQAFDNIGQIRYFVYKVRCNIFHGRKSIADARETAQNKRIEVYYRFLQGLVGLFFAVVENDRTPEPSSPAGRDFGKQRIDRVGSADPDAVVE